MIKVIDGIKITKLEPWTEENQKVREFDAELENLEREWNKRKKVREVKKRFL